MFYRRQYGELWNKHFDGIAGSIALMNFSIICLMFLGNLVLGGISCAAQISSTRDGLKKPAQAQVTPEEMPDTVLSPSEGGELLVDVSRDFPTYFEDIMGGEAALALAERRYPEARELFDDLANNTSDIEITPRARFLSAWLSERMGDDTRALAELPPLAEELTLLADTIHFLAARSAFRLGQFKLTADLAAKVGMDSLSSADATMLRGDALAGAQKYGDAVRAFQVYVKKWPGGLRTDEAKAKIVECLTTIVDLGGAEQNKEELASQALKLLTQLRIQDPGSQWTDAAARCEKKIYRALKRRIPAVAQEKKGALLAYSKGSSLLQRMRNSQAEQMLTRAVSLSRAGGNLECLARYDRARAVARQRRHEEAAGLFEEASGTCKNENTRIKALYSGAKAFQAAGLCPEAIRLFSEIESSFDYHSYADDARLKAAKCYRSMGEHRRFVELLETLPENYPAGDMRADALWLLAHDAVHRNELIEAREYLESYYRLFPNERAWRSAGRSGYWLGRVEEMLGSTEVAISHYENVVATSPLTFYMVLAFNRLEQLQPERAKKLKEKLIGKSEARPHRFSKRLLAEHVNLARGIEFYRLGLSDLAAREFQYLRSLPEVPADIHWLTAVLLRRTERFQELHELADGTDDSWMKRYPREEDLDPWYLAFPRAYEDEVNAAAKEAELSANMIWGVMREESGFDVKSESTANALGLMQLILPTAKAMGKEIGIRVNKRTLSRPRVNIRLGAAYLKYLSEKFNDNAALVIAAYNAGEGTVAKWHRGRPRDHVDLFIEDIPYSQTRGYTKRVLTTWARYHFLYEEGHPILPIDLVLP